MPFPPTNLAGLLLRVFLRSPRHAYSMLLRAPESSLRSFHLPKGPLRSLGCCPRVSPPNGPRAWLSHASTLARMVSRVDLNAQSSCTLHVQRSVYLLKCTVTLYTRVLLHPRKQEQPQHR